MRRIMTCLIFSYLIYLPYAYATAVHTWHDVTTDNGTWHGRLALITSDQAGYFTDKAANNKGQIYDFELDSQKIFIYGFGFEFGKTDFDVAYTLTLYQTGFASKACVFVVTAKGPARPDVRISSYHDAKCNYEVVHGRGENFSVS